MTNDSRKSSKNLDNTDIFLFFKMPHSKTMWKKKTKRHSSLYLQGYWYTSKKCLKSIRQSTHALIEQFQQLRAQRELTNSENNKTIQTPVLTPHLMWNNECPSQRSRAAKEYFVFPFLLNAVPKTLDYEIRQEKEKSMQIERDESDWL